MDVKLLRDAITDRPTSYEITHYKEAVTDKGEKVQIVDKLEVVAIGQLEADLARKQAEVADLVAKLDAVNKAEV